MIINKQKGLPSLNFKTVFVLVHVCYVNHMWSSVARLEAVAVKSFNLMKY